MEWITQFLPRRAPAVSGQQKQDLLFALADLVHAGVQLPDALSTLRDIELSGRGSGRAAAALAAWRRAILDGHSVARALSASVAPEERMLIEARDQAGQLAEGLREAAQISGRSNKLLSTLGRQVGPAALNLVLVDAMFVAFDVWGIPLLSQILPVERWSTNLKALAAVSSFMTIASIPLVAGGLVATVLISSSISRWTGPGRNVADRFPPWSLYRLLGGTRFLVAFGALRRSRQKNDREILEALREPAGPWLRSILDAARTQMMRGASGLGDALHQAGLEFPTRRAVGFLRAYSTLPQAVQQRAIEDLPDQLLSEAERRVAYLASVLGVVLDLLTTGVTLWMFAALGDVTEPLLRQTGF